MKMEDMKTQYRDKLLPAVKRRSFFGYIAGGLAGLLAGGSSLRVVSLAAKHFNPSGEKITVRINPLAVPRTNKKHESSG